MAFQNVLLLLLLATQHVVNAQLDPLDNYCRRLDHQSTVINGMLYIDGGRELFASYFSNGTVNGTRTLGNNQYLIAVNMSESWDWKNSLPQVEYQKLQDVTGAIEVPDMSRGALYPDPVDSNKFWLFGGSTAVDNQTFPGWEYPLPQANSLWSYNALNNSWKAYDMSSYGVHKPASGATAYVPDKGLAFYFNGEQDNGTSSETTSLVSNIKFLDGMLVLDLNKQSAKNISTAAVSDLARVRGGMVHVPLNGSDGILVLAGGGEKTSADNTHDWKGELVSFESVDIFDVGSLNDPSTPDGVWYSQNTTGNIPQPRLDACYVVASAPDNSSHNIYMYGGRDGLNTYYDEVWILTIPSFQWVLANAGSSPRYSMTCHLVGNRQMITIGGADTSTSKMVNACDWETKGVAILDLSTITWGSAFSVDAGQYTVPDIVVKMIGGSSVGAAKTITPSSGFGSPKLAALFGQGNNATITAPPATTSSPAATSKKHTSAGAIAGGVIGGLAVVAAILGAILFFLNRVKQNRKNRPTATQLDGNPINHGGMVDHGMAENGGVLDSKPLFEKAGESDVVRSELPSKYSKSDFSSQREEQELVPVEMPAEEVQRWNMDNKRAGSNEFPR